MDKDQFSDSLLGRFLGYCVFFSALINSTGWGEENILHRRLEIQAERVRRHEANDRAGLRELRAEYGRLQESLSASGLRRLEDFVLEAALLGAPKAAVRYRELGDRLRARGIDPERMRVVEATYLTPGGEEVPFPMLAGFENNESDRYLLIPLAEGSEFEATYAGSHFGEAMDDLLAHNELPRGSLRFVDPDHQSTVIARTYDNWDVLTNWLGVGTAIVGGALLGSALLASAVTFAPMLVPAALTGLATKLAGWASALATIGLTTGLTSLGIQIKSNRDRALAEKAIDWAGLLFSAAGVGLMGLGKAALALNASLRARLGLAATGFGLDGAEFSHGIRKARELYERQAPWLDADQRARLARQLIVQSIVDGATRVLLNLDLAPVIREGFRSAWRWALNGLGKTISSPTLATPNGAMIEASDTVSTIQQMQAEGRASGGETSTQSHANAGAASAPRKSLRESVRSVVRSLFPSLARRADWEATLTLFGFLREPQSAFGRSREAARLLAWHYTKHYESRGVYLSAGRIRTRRVDTNRYLARGGTTEGIRVGSIDHLGLPLLAQAEGNLGKENDYLYFDFSSDNVTIDPTTSRVAVNHALRLEEDGILRVLEFDSPLPLSKVLDSTGKESDLSRLGYRSIRGGESSKSRSHELFGSAGVRHARKRVITSGTSREEIRSTLRGFPENGNQVVVKPEGRAQGAGVRILPVDDPRIPLHVDVLLRRGADSVLLEERIESYPVSSSEGVRLDHNLRVLASWHNGRLYLSPDSIEFRVNTYSEAPVNVSQKASVWTFKDGLNRMGFPAEEQERLFSEINAISRGIAEVSGDESMTFGLDLILGQDSRLYGIEVNTGPVGGYSSLFDVQLSDRQARVAALKPLAQFYSDLPSQQPRPVERDFELHFGAVDEVMALDRNLRDALVAEDRPRIAQALARYGDLVSENPNRQILESAIRAYALAGDVDAAFEIGPQLLRRRSEHNTSHTQLFDRKTIERRPESLLRDERARIDPWLALADLSGPVPSPEAVLGSFDPLSLLHLNSALQHRVVTSPPAQLDVEGPVVFTVENWHQALIHWVDDGAQDSIPELEWRIEAAAKTITLMDALPTFPQAIDLVDSGNPTMMAILTNLDSNLAAQLLTRSTSGVLATMDRLIVDGIARVGLEHPHLKDKSDRLMNAYLDEVLFTGDREVLIRQAVDASLAWSRLDRPDQESLLNPGEDPREFVRRAAQNPRLGEDYLDVLLECIQFKRNSEIDRPLEDAILDFGRGD